MALADTNIFASLRYTGGAASAVVAHMKTIEWWQQERKNFKLFCAKSVVDELMNGNFAGQREAVATARRR